MVEQEYAILLEEFGAVYIDIAKVASSSLKAAFATALGFDYDSIRGNPHDIEYPRPQETNGTSERFFPGLFTFAFVRNPWDRLVSCYRDKIGGEVKDYTGFSDAGIAHCLTRFDVFSANMSFEEFVDAVAAIPDAQADEHFRSQHDYLTNIYGYIAVDYVGRYEDLEADFRYVAERIGLPEYISLPRLQANSRSVNYTDYYTATTRSIVADRYSQDIEFFSYRFN